MMSGGQESKITITGLNDRFEFAVYGSDAPLDSIPGVFALSRRTMESGHGLNLILSMGESKNIRDAVARVADHPALTDLGFNAVCVLPVADAAERQQIFEQLARARDLPCGVIRD